MRPGACYPRGTRYEEHTRLGEFRGSSSRVQVPMVRHFLLTVGRPRRGTQATRTARQRRRVRRAADHTAEDWHVGFEPDQETISPMSRAASPLLPECGHDLARTARLGDSRPRPGVLVQVVRAFHPEPPHERHWWRYRSRWPQHWIGAFGTGSDHVLVTLHAISREAMTTYSDRLSALLPKAILAEIWRQDGMALTEIKDGQPVFTSKVHFGTPTASA